MRIVYQFIIERKTSVLHIVLGAICIINIILLKGLIWRLNEINRIKHLARYVAHIKKYWQLSSLHNFGNNYLLEISIFRHASSEYVLF